MYNKNFHEIFFFKTKRNYLENNFHSYDDSIYKFYGRIY